MQAKGASTENPRGAAFSSDVYPAAGTHRKKRQPSLGFSVKTLFACMTPLHKEQEGGRLIPSAHVLRGVRQAKGVSAVKLRGATSSLNAFLHRENPKGGYPLSIAFLHTSARKIKEISAETPPGSAATPPITNTPPERHQCRDTSYGKNSPPNAHQSRNTSNHKHTPLKTHQCHDTSMANKPLDTHQCRDTAITSSIYIIPISLYYVSYHSNKH
ncbi:hypothetical protein DUNSADRAFT_10395 [Dunaliella salina]|uniref:Encoded protein n=1 Tax=Dunaliella salina TaxID=3046 RepID=A0ABQ7GFH5_DUNSA|nr:hypothetical protein DUNSADRAFT_10395 [Dunaliella salina]|eukprot:KAF5833354.1 hypothetical protein DUNSADRAFT_10395 [Dunaliella salina]